MELDSVTGGRGRNARSPVLLRTHCTAKLRSHWHRSATVQRGERTFWNRLHSLKLFFCVPVRRWTKDVVPHTLYFVHRSFPYNLFPSNFSPYRASAVADFPFWLSHILSLSLLFSRFLLQPHFIFHSALLRVSASCIKVDEILSKDFSKPIRPKCET